MTVKELAQLSVGTRVEWMGEEHCSGFTCKPVGVPLFIQWIDGKTTSGNDDAALAYVFTTEQPPTPKEVV